jgi:hypothetical protein
MSEVLAAQMTGLGEHGVEPICRVLPIAPSTFRKHAAQRRNP